MGSREESAAGQCRRAPATSSKPAHPRHTAAGRGAWSTPLRSRRTAITPTTLSRLPRMFRPAAHRSTTTPSRRPHWKPRSPGSPSRLLRWRCSCCGRASSPGRSARLLAEAMPWSWVPWCQRVTRPFPLFKTLFPIQAFPVQLVHHDDVAAAIALAATTSAPAGAYNIAGDGVVSMSDVVAALGGRPVRVPAVAATVALGALARLPFVPSAAHGYTSREPRW